MGRWQSRVAALIATLPTQPWLLAGAGSGLFTAAASAQSALFQADLNNLIEVLVIDRELLAFDALVIRMRLVELSHHRMKLHFDYWRESKPTLKGDGRAGGSAAGREQAEELVARGEQDLACMRRQGGKLLPEAWPEVMLEALRPYAEG